MVKAFDSFDLKNLKKGNRPLFISIGCFLLLLVIFTYPLFVRGKIEKKFLELIQLTEKSLKGQAQIESEYLKGVYSSEATIRLKLKQDDMGLIGKAKISHFTGHVTTELSIDPERAKNITKRFDQVPVLKVSSCFGPLGGQSHSYSLSPFQTKPMPGEESGIEFGGLNGELDLYSNMIPKFFDFNLNELKLKEGLRVRYFKNLGIIFRIDRGRQVVDSSLEFFFDKYDDLEEEFGPGILEFKAKNLDSESLGKIQKTITDFKSSSGSMSGEDLKMKLMMNAMGILPGLMKRSPSLEISHLRIKTKKGDFEGSAQVKLKDSSLGVGFLSFFSNIQVLIQGVAPLPVVNSLVEQVLKTMAIKKMNDPDALKGDKGQEVLKEIGLKVQSEREEKVKEFIGKKFLKEVKNGLSFRFEWKDGQMTLNDQPFSIRL